MDNDLERYKEQYRSCLRNLTFDWKERRKNIHLPDTEDDPYRPGYCTQYRFSQMIGITVHAYRQLEAGNSRPRLSTYCKVQCLFEDFNV